jgi:uncharacterized RDD family membrane protein YckC
MEYTMSPVGAPSTPSAEQGAVMYAGFWRRFAAFILDWLILGAIYGIIGFLFGGWYANDYSDPNSHQVFAGTMRGTWLIFFAASWLYHAYMESSKNQGTIGKIALGLRVTDLDGKRINFGRATGRFFAKILSMLIFFIGYIMAGFTPKKQALHDFVAGTLVLSKLSTVPVQVAENAFSGS